MNETERKERLEQLISEKYELMKQLHKLNSKILKNGKEQTELRLFPFHEGERAICTLKDNKKAKEPFECIVNPLYKRTNK